MNYFDHLIIADWGNFRGNLWTAIWAIWTIITSIIIIRINQKQIQLEHKQKYNIELKIIEDSLKNTEEWLTQLPEYWFINDNFQRLSLINYWNWEAKKIFITLLYNDNEYKDYISFISSKEIRYLFSQIIKSKIPFYQIWKELKINFKYYDELWKKHSKDLCYKIQENYILERQY